MGIKRTARKIGKALDTAADVAGALTSKGEPDVTVKTETGPGDSVSVSAEPVTATTKISKAVAGTPGNFAGALAIAGALLLNPDFATRLGTFTVGLARGEGGWGALTALVGAGLLAYRHRPAP